MSLEKGFGAHRDTFTEQDRFDSVSTSATMDVSDNVLHVTGFSEAVTITLPPVSLAAGQIYAIKVLDDSSVNAITVADNDESRSWSDLTISNASGGKAVLYSDGEEWHQIASTNVS